MSDSKVSNSSSKHSSKVQIKFEDGEKVLCFHGDLIYEAKCSKVDFSRSNDRVYFVHYSGWNKNWDEWVSTKRILKFNDENVKKQQELIVQSRFSAKKVKFITQNKKEESVETEGSESKKARKLEDNASNEEEAKRKICVVDIYSKHNIFLTNPKIKINIPLSLQEWLIDDLDAIMQQNKLVKVPNSNTVKSILDDYKRVHVKELQGDEKNINEVNETISGLIRYFNVMLGSQLLYKFERIQYSELLNSNKVMSNIYGAIHLLRLLEKLDEIIAYAPLEASKLEGLIAQTNSILRYLDKNHLSLFKSEDYIIAPPNYIRAAF